MSQDYVDDVYDSTFVVQTTMANVEKNFAALKSSFSGAAAPSNPIAGMWWFDTTANLLKLRNEANNAWQSVWNFANNKPVVTNNISADFGAALKNPAVGTAGLRTLGTTALKACAGNDARLSDDRDPPDASVTEVKIGAAAVSQAKLKTSQGEVSTSSTIPVNLTLPGGEYGFYPRLKRLGGQGVKTVTAQLSGGDLANFSLSYITNITLHVGGEGNVAYAQQRYVTSSGEVHWVFILRDKITKQVLSMYQAPDHPCFGNGGKPLLVPHPFGDYDETKHEIIVINPSLKEIEQMELETIVDDETLPDKDLLEIITENYEIDEDSNPAWPSIPVTVGLPKHVKDKKTGKKILAGYRFMKGDTIIEPVKKRIVKPDFIKVKSLKRKLL